MSEEVYIDSDGSTLTVKRQDKSGVVRYFKNKYHHLNAPAVDHVGGPKEWYQNDKRHRLDGPAIEWPNGCKRWFVNDKEVEPLFLVAYWLERGRCCWYNETTQALCFSDP